jgi:hypothetical protein
MASSYVQAGCVLWIQAGALFDRMHEMRIHYIAVMSLT